MTAYNSIYNAAFQQWKANPATSVYISTNDTAKLMRSALKAKFPGIKFSVRGSKYSGGSSITVSWTDGPTEDLVNELVKAFAGSGFDGMSDYKYSIGAWLNPQGLASTRRVEAHYGTDGDTIEAAQDGAIPVSFSTDFVFTRRTHSLEHMRRTLISYAVRHPGCPLAEAIYSGDVEVKESKWGGAELTGNPHLIRDAVGGGHRYGGDVVLHNHAHRRMSPIKARK